MCAKRQLIESEANLAYEINLNHDMPFQGK